MPARAFLPAAISACLLPVLVAQTPQPAAPAATSAKSDLSGEGAVVETIASTVRFAKDGSSVRTLRVVTRVLSDAGVRNAGVLSYPYASAVQTLTFDAVRVHKPSGEWVETPVYEAQEVPMPVTQQAPMYSDLRMKQLPVKSLSVGDTVEYRITIKGTNAEAPGSFWDAFSFTTGLPVKDETLELRVPRELAVLVKSKEVQPTVSDEAGERVYRWKHETASEYPKKNQKDTTAPVGLVQETYEPDVAVTSFHSWAEVGTWYRGLMKDRAMPDAAIQAKADELTHGLTTDDAKIDAIYHYVSTQYRYIAVSFGIGRLQPHTAAEVFRNQYGDCKDKHTLLQAMLAAEKIEAEPVLIGSGVRVNEALPTPSQFDHMITLVKLKDRDIWLDATPEVAPSRMLLAGLRDKLALAIPATGDAKLVRTEATLPFPSYVHETVTGQLDTHGVLTAHFDMTLRGDDEVIYRTVYRQVARAQWQELEQHISYNSGFAGDVSAVDAMLPEKTADPFYLSWDYTRKAFGDWDNRRFPGLTPWFEVKIADDATAPKRAMVLDPTAQTEVKVTLKLPEGYTVTVPADVKRSTPFAEYISTYALQDRTLVMDRTMRYKARELPVSEFGAYRDFLKAVSDDAGQMLQLVGSSVNSTATAKAENSAAGELIEQAYQQFRAKDYKSVRELLDKATALNDQQKGLWGEYGALDWSGNKTQAAAEYRKEIDLHPDSFFAYKDLTNLYMSQGQWSDAEQTARAWAKADPADAQPHALLGSLQLMQTHYKDAELSLKDAMTLSKDPAPMKVQLGQAQLLAGDVDAGKATLHSLMDTSEDPNILNSTAYELGDAGADLPAAEAASSKAIATLETRAAATTVDTAKNEDFANVNELAANWDTRGWIAFKQGKPADAESYVRSAWMLYPHLVVGEHLGEIYEAEGKKEDALATYRLALKAAGGGLLPPRYTQVKEKIEAKITTLQAAGVHEKPGLKVQQGSNEMAAMRTYTIPSPLNGQYVSADFLLMLGDNRAESVRFLKGDEALKKEVPALLGATYRAPLPTGSKAKVLRRGIVACTTGSTTCLLVLIEPTQARID